MTTTQGPTGRAAVYCRISEDDGSAAGVGDQERDGRALCIEQGWLPTVFTDNDVSAAVLFGKKAKQRDDFDRMVADVAAGHFDVIVCRDLPRLTRDARQGINLLQGDWPEVAQQYGRLQVWYHDPDVYGLGIDFASGRGLKEARSALMIAAEYAETISVHVKRAKRRHADAGLPSGGPRPFGYEAAEYATVRRNGKEVTEFVRQELCTREAEAIADAVTDVIERNATAYGIARDWNAAGLSTVLGKSWRAAQVRRILTSPRIAGLVERDGEVHRNGDGSPVQGQWPAIVNPATRENVIRHLIGNQGTGRAKASAKYPYPLRGVLVCGDCGRKLSGNASHVPNYVCKKYSEVQSGDGGCGLQVQAAWVERMVFPHVVSFLDTPGLTDDIHAEHEADQAASNALLEANELDRATLTELRDDYYTHKVLTDKAYFLSRTRELEAAIAERDSQRVALRGTSVLDEYAGRGSEWDSFDVATQQEITTALLESVTVSRATQRGPRALTPDRIRFQWRYNVIGEVYEAVIGEAEHFLRTGKLTEEYAHTGRFTKH